MGIDTVRGIFHMLPDKLKSMFTSLGELCESTDTTPRLISRVREKLLHYGVAIPYVAIAAPSLSQCMHGRETGVGPTSVPNLDNEDVADFDWDRHRTLSPGSGPGVLWPSRTRP